jgi:hypothetical protein
LISYFYCSFVCFAGLASHYVGILPKDDYANITGQNFVSLSYFFDDRHLVAANVRQIFPGMSGGCVLKNCARQAH